MNEIKFRTWSDKIKKFYYWNAKDNQYNERFWTMVRNGDGFRPAQMYIGKKDKNYKEIYEGDRVRILYANWASKPDNPNTKLIHVYSMKSKSSVGTIVYIEQSFQLWTTSHLSPLYEGKFGEIEVIGHIYDGHIYKHFQENKED